MYVACYLHNLHNYEQYHYSTNQAYRVYQGHKKTFKPGGATEAE